MTTNTAPINGNETQGSSQGPLIYTNSLFNDSMSSTCNYHKSFDFSNINIGNSQYKQFHQTRIYVKNFSGMTSNGQQFGGNGSTYIISGNLPESFQYSIGSDWASPLSDIFKGVGNLALQLGSAFLREQNRSSTGKTVGQLFTSGVNRAANFLIWNGAKPLELQLKIPVLDDNSYQNKCGIVKTNLKEALEFLGCLCLPSSYGSLGFYTPAPSPLSLTFITDRKNDKEESFSFAPNLSRTMVQIGGMLFIDNCIIKNVSVSYPNTKSLMLRENGSLTPILAEVTITITTIETLTSSTYTKMLWLKQQKGQGKGTVDLPAIKAAISDVSNKGTEIISQVWTSKDETVDSTSNPEGSTDSEGYRINPITKERLPDVYQLPQL